MNFVKKASEIAIMREGGAIFTDIFLSLEKLVTVGATSEHIEHTARALIKKRGVEPAFLGYDKFPATTCISINEVMVHDIPNKTPFKNGDIVKIDFGIKYKGYYLDGAKTYLVGTADVKKQQFVTAGYAIFQQALNHVVPPINTYELGAYIEGLATEYHCWPVRELVGHGIGKKLHDEPQIPCYKPTDGKSGTPLIAGMTIALEIMLAESKTALTYADNSYGIKTKNNSLALHIEETIAITPHGCERLTPITQQ